MEEEFYVCISCGYEDDVDKFGRFCPNCGEDLDVLEDEMDFGFCKTCNQAICKCEEC